LIRLYVNAYYNQNILEVTNEVKSDDASTSENSKYSKMILESKESITDEFIDSIINTCLINSMKQPTIPDTPIF
jgi:hypothetical protein